MRKRIGHLLAAMMFFSVSSYAATPEIVILFDQSGSMSLYDPKMLSGIWLSTAVLTFEAPIRISLNGFDYELHQYLSVVIRGEAERSALSDTLNKIETNGPATDLEVPFRYVLDRGADDSLKMVLIITDGKPEVWDKELGFLSLRVLTDDRYGDLNAQYRNLKASGLSEPELYSRLSAEYSARNLALIEKTIAQLGGEKGKKLVIWDISGTSEFLSRWAGLTNAVYMPLDTLSTSEPPIKALRELLTATQQTASTLLEKPLPADYSDRANDALEDVAEAPSTEQTADPGATRTPAQRAEIQKERTQAAPLPDSSGNFAIVFIVLLMFALLVFILGLILYRRHKSLSLSKIERNGSTPGMVSSESEEGSVREPTPDLREKTGEESCEGPELDLSSEHPVTDIKFDNDEILNYIDRRIESALGNVEEFIGGTFRDVSINLAPEKRLSLRVKTPPGSIVVHWTDREGVDKSANAIDISMHGVLFETDLCETNSIDYIEVPRSGLRIDVALSTIKRRTAGKYVVHLVAFEREIEDRKTWVELQTRIGGED
ncbi:MAG: hypothetical protein FVQ81_03930 [Candidatus Glassbacteria bacterium]|nr:hypothetical protein [Candidatus Glassbacteria bacterium]